VEKKSIYSLLSKPVRRYEMVLGKYCGLVLTLFVNVAVMTLAFYAVLAYIGWSAPAEIASAWPAPAADPAMIDAIVLIACELMLVTAIALFFSTFSTPFLSAVLTLGIWVIGHFNADMRNMEGLVGPVAGWIGRVLSYVQPNFAAFDVKAQVVHVQPVAASYVALTSLYAVTYVALVLVGAVLIFSRRDFK
jgi:ABC-type transport system involved in multi-copper enzyme maturation permease subunit